MTEIIEQILSLLVNDATLTALCPAANIFTGPVDVSMEAQASLLYPQINLSISSDISRTVPLNARDTIVQIDVWSRQSQLEVLNIYERIVYLLNYTSGDINTAHVFWDRLNSAVDMYESDRRVFRRSSAFRVWAQKP
jgi:hypothetical protein